MSAKKKLAKSITLDKSLLRALGSLALVPAVKEPAAAARAKRKNPARDEISFAVRALLAAKAGTEVEKVGQGQNLGMPAPLGLDIIAFVSLIKPLNAVLDNYENSKNLKTKDLRELYEKKKNVRDLVDLIHRKAQYHN